MQMVDDKSLETHLAEILESDLREFFSHSIPERLEQAQNLFRFNNEHLRLILGKYADFIEQDLKEKSLEEKAEYLYFQDNNFRSYLNFQYQHILHTLPYFLWASHLIFDGTYSQLTYEAKEELRKHCSLDTPKKRKDFFTNLFTRFTDEKVIDGGRQSHWNEWTRLYFLALYEKFSVVIENVRKDLKILKNQKVSPFEARKKIFEKYQIPEDVQSEVSGKNRKDALARKLASRQMQKSFDQRFVKEMGFADSYLIKVLRSARKDAEKHMTCSCRNYSNHKLIFLSWGDPNLIRHIYRLNKVALDDLKFDSFVHKKFPGMELYFV